nr:hypothetical protein [Saprospiraceae bacterium]
MLQYLLKRLLIFIPTLLAISLLSFGLSKLAPGDPVDQSNRGGMGDAQRDLINAERVYQEKARELGLDKPAFYCGVSPVAFPDTLYRILKREQRENLSKLTAQYGNWEQISDYYHEIKTLEYQVQQLPANQKSDGVFTARSTLQQLYLAHSDVRISSLLDGLATAVEKDTALAPTLLEP